MGRIDKWVAFFAVFISTTLLFQNCGAPSAAKKSASININGESVSPDVDYGNLSDPNPNPQPEPEPIPEPVDPTPTGITNRNIALDNKVKFGEVNYTTGVGDILMYETDYLATTKSTLVRIMDSASFVKLTVDSDQCTGEMELDGMDVGTFGQLVFDAFLVTSERSLVGDEAVTSNCGFPRVLLNASTLPAGGITNRGDLDIFLSARECVPDGELFITGSTANQIRSATQNFMRALIDEVCGL